MYCAGSPRRGTRSGFTLLEVLISLALIGALLGALFSFYFNLLQSRTRIAERADQVRGAELLMEHVERALMFCIAGDTTFGPGIDGNSDRLSILTRGVLPALDAARANVSLMDLQRVEVTTAPSGPANMRREAMRAGTSERAGAGALASQLGMVRFRYYDGSQWLDTFNSMQAGALPRAIEVAIWFDDPRPQDEIEADAEPASDEEDASDLFDPLSDDLFAEDASFEDEDDEWPLPDRHRIIVIPDAEQAAEEPTEAAS